MLIFEISVDQRQAQTLLQDQDPVCNDIPRQFLRKSAPMLPQVSELQVVRHFTRLSQQNFSIDSHFYPLGSCTMKYNPRAAHKLAMLPEFLQRHPFAHLKQSQGYMQCMFELQEMLANITGMHAVSLNPMAGAQGEFVGIAMIRAYHMQRGDTARCEILVPDTAHGTNPASAAMCGYKVREIATDVHGDIDLESLRKHLGPQTAGLMLTNPSTLGLFERNIKQVAELVHACGGLLYYDGANLNAILGRVRPGDMGFDVMHLNLHKTFATPHGGGGPGAGPVAANHKLAAYLPVPMIGLQNKQYIWLDREQKPDSIGRVSACMGNAGVLLRAYAYILLLGRTGLRTTSNMAVLNANYVMQKLIAIGYTAAYPQRKAMHEFVISLAAQKKQFNITALDFAKLILDTGMHAPTIYFPLNIPECWLVEPTETETKNTLDFFVAVMQDFLHRAASNAQDFKLAPQTLPVLRLDEVQAAKELNVAWNN